MIISFQVLLSSQLSPLQLGVERDYRLSKRYLVFCLGGIEGKLESIEVMARAEAVAHLAGGMLRASTQPTHSTDVEPTS